MAMGTVKDKKGASPKKGANAGPTIEELKVQLDEVVNKIRAALKGKNDKNDIQSEDRNKLRQHYSKAAQISKSISTRTTDTEEAKKYKDLYEKFSNEAANYGSTIKGIIPKKTFDDVKGLDNVKKLVKSFLFMAQHPELVKYYKIEGGLGMLLYGAPGTGKTMFAEAIASEMNLPLFIVTPADIFKSYVGESEQAVKQLFLEIDACPDGAILFIDECESIFSKRTSDTKDYKSAVTTELLQRINGFGVEGSNRIMIAATNRPEIIDSAYLRYKRFSHLVHVTPPDETAIRAIIESKIGDIKLSGISIDDIFNMTQRKVVVKNELSTTKVSPGKYSSADICGIIEEACRLALEEIEKNQGHTEIPLTREMFEKAFAKIPPSISHELEEEYNNFRKNINS